MALQVAIANIARAANTRSGYAKKAQIDRSAGMVTFTINGTDRTRLVSRYESEINDAPNEVPNTASLMVRGFTPAVGNTVSITRNLDNSILFAGVITSITYVRRRTGTRLRYRLECMDWTFLLDRRLVHTNYASQAANTTAAAILSTYASGFTTGNIEPGLASTAMQTTMDTVSRALTRLANLVGAFWYVDYEKDLHFRLTENLVNPTALTTTNATAFKRVGYVKSIDQVRTRVYVEGLGAMVAGNVPAGDTMIPVDAFTNFASAGGSAIQNGQILTYTGRNEVSPGAAPALSISPGAGLTADSTYTYAFTFVTAAGETTASPTSSIVTTAPTAPATGPTATELSPGSEGTLAWAVGASVYGIVTYRFGSGGETVASPVSATIVATSAGFGGNACLILMTNIPVSGDVSVTAKRLYLNINGAWGGYYDIATSATSYKTGSTLTAGSPPAAGSVSNQVALTSVVVGPSGTTQRKVYRTVAGGSQLKLQSTIANNTATTLTDSTADGSLGANVPTADTAGLSSLGSAITTVAAAVGDTTITLPTTVFATAGGWAKAGEIAIRYTGKSGTQLTGIPASGGGSITATLPIGSFVQGLPALTGVPASGTGAISNAIRMGDEINLIVTVDDTTAQTALAALEGGDGIHEHYIQDRRLSVAGATARGTAELILGKDPDETVTFTSEDWNCQSGRSVTVNVGGISVTVKIQQVRISWTIGRWLPQRAVTATNRFKDFYQYVRDLEDKSARVT